MIEPGQNRKIAALRSSVRVHFFYGGCMNDFMNLAVKQALIAASNDEVPIGAVIVRNNEILSCCYNRKNIDNVAVYHAEILCIIEACKKIDSWYLNDCDIYVTLKPCAMCLAALAEARIKNIYYLLESNYEDNFNSNLSNINLCNVDDDYNYEKILKCIYYFISLLIRGNKLVTRGNCTL